MWLMTKFGFYSVVAHRERLDQVLVRGRKRQDLVQLLQLGRDLGIAPLPEIVDTPDADYACRLFMDRQVWQRLAAVLALGIDYPNFKEAVHGEPARDRAYLDCWSALRRFQTSTAALPQRYLTDTWDDAPAVEWAAVSEYQLPLGLGAADEAAEEDAVFDYLDELRDSGETNMFGAGPYLEARFGFDSREAREWLVRWMQAFGEM